MSAAHAVSARTWRTIVSSTGVTAWHISSWWHAACLLLSSRTTMGRRCGTAVASIQRHVLHVATHLARSQVLERLLKVLYVPPRIPNLAVHTRIDGGVVGGLSHLIRSVDYSLLAVYLSIDLTDRGLFIHLDGASHPLLCGPLVIFSFSSQSASGRSTCRRCRIAADFRSCSNHAVEMSDCVRRSHEPPLGRNERGRWCAARRGGLKNRRSSEECRYLVCPCYD